MTMTKTNIAVVLYDSHTRAQAAEKALQRAGFDTKKISIIGRNRQPEEHVGGISALAGALMAAGIPRDSVLRYETALKANKFMLVVHGDAQEIRRAHDLLKTSGHSSFDNHRHHVEDPSPAHA
jgi:hypothetical protein